MKKTLGFSLIELLIAVSIMVVLLGIAAVSFAQAQKSVRDNKRKVDMQTVAQAITLYRSDEGAYPDATNYTEVGEWLVGQGYLPDPYPRNDRIPEYNYVFGDACVCAQMEDVTKGNSNATCSLGAATTHYCVRAM